jgi:hypothetical protein
VLIDGYDREGAPSTTVLLTADPQTLTRRGVLWQGQGDVLGVSRFVATTDTEARPSSFPDIKREWVDFWGANHVQNVRPAKGLFALARGKIAPGKLKPEDFVLTPEVTGKPLEVGADPAHLGLK